MKLTSRISAWVTFAAVLCFAPWALGQGTLPNAAGAGSHVLGYAPSSFFVLTFGPGGGGGKGGGGWNGGGGGNGCGGNGDGGWGGQGWGGGGNGGGGGCQQVPEGGSTSQYLLLAGLCCLGGMLVRFRRQAGEHANN